MFTIRVLARIGVPIIGLLLLGSGPARSEAPPIYPAPAGTVTEEAVPSTTPTNVSVTPELDPSLVPGLGFELDYLLPIELPSSDPKEGVRTLTDANPDRHPLPLTTGEQAKLAAARAAVEASKSAGIIDPAGAGARPTPEVEAAPTADQLEEVNQEKMERLLHEVQAPMETDPAMAPGFLIDGRLQVAPRVSEPAPVTGATRNPAKTSTESTSVDGEEEPNR